MPTVVPVELLEALAAEAPADPPRHEQNGHHSNGQSFDIDSFIQRHGLEVDGPDTYQGGRRWTFRQSPICEHHDDGPYLIQFANGALSAGCHHHSCSWGWRELRADYEAQKPRVYTPGGDTLPEVLLHGGEQTISATGRRLGELLAERETHFLRGGAVVRVAEDYTLHPVRPSELASDIEAVAQLVKTVAAAGGGVMTVPATCSKSTAELILASQAFTLALPPLKLIAQCPVLVERDGVLVVATGYDRASGILARGQCPEEMTLDDAVELLTEMLADFQFASFGDRSRALAASITPALVQGGLLPGRAPADLGEANVGQSGKGFRNKLTAATYGCMPYAVTMRKRGVGGLEESFDRALISGKSFISLDNLRGHVDCQAIESFLTEDTYSARSAYRPVTEIDPRRVVVMLTSNRADLTDDMANRCSIVRMLKRPDGHQFRLYPEGDILDHVRADQPLYLGAVYAVIRAWHAAGSPRTDETRHDFRVWAQTLD